MSPSHQRVALSFEGCRVPADIDCPPELLDVLAVCGVEAVAVTDEQRPSIILRPGSGRFHLSGPAYLSPFSVEGVDAALGSVMAGLAACKSLSVDGHVLCVHGAAAVINGRGYLFLAPFGTGKSSLIAELALRGAHILADDVVQLNVRDRLMSGLQMPMRLRRAFTETADPRMKAWIAENGILAGSRYSFLTPGVLTTGQHALTDIVLLSRMDEACDSDMVLEQASPAELIPRILWHNMSRHHTPSAIARMAAALAEDLRGCTLHATSFAGAAERLVMGDIPISPASGRTALSVSRRQDLHVLRSERGAIVSDDQTGRIFEINESAFVILTLLQELDDIRKVRDVLPTIYPDASEPELLAQLSACVRQFGACGLIDISRSGIAEWAVAEA